MKKIVAEVDRLSALETDGRHVLSVYLSTDPARGPGRNLRAHVNEVLQTVQSTAGGDPAELEAELERVRVRIANLGELPRGLALFFGESIGLGETLSLPVAPKPGAYWARRLNLRPLLSLLDEYEPTLLLLVDKERARLFRWVLDAVEEIEAFEDDVPGRHAQGGESQKNYQRHHDEHVLQHVRRAVDMLTRRVDADRVRRVALGGPAEVLGLVRRSLPPAVAARVAGTVGVAVSAAAHEVLDAARAVRASWERTAEERLVARLEEDYGRGRSALGPSDVVSAVLEQRVRTLVYAAGTAVPGARCHACGSLYATAAEACEACGSATETVDDLLDLLAFRVLHAGGGIEEVRGPAAESLDAHQGIAATLLYATSAERSA